MYGSAPMTGTEGIATSTGISGIGVYGRSDASWGTGVYGWATDENGYNYGVQGQSNSTSGYGVFGWATATSGPSFGVAGRSDSPYGVGVNGRADHGTGVNGQADDPNGIGVVGVNNATDGNAYAVYGSPPDGWYCHLWHWKYWRDGRNLSLAGGLWQEHLDGCNQHPHRRGRRDVWIGRGQPAQRSGAGLCYQPGRRDRAARPDCRGRDCGVGRSTGQQWYRYLWHCAGNRYGRDCYRFQWDGFWGIRPVCIE